MASRTTVNISLTPELGQFVDSEVASGRYKSASEVFREGLRLLQDRHAQQEAALTEVRRKIREGLDAAQRGELIDGEEVFREIQELSRKRKSTEKTRPARRKTRAK